MHAPNHVCVCHLKDSYLRRILDFSNHLYVYHSSRVLKHHLSLSFPIGTILVLIQYIVGILYLLVYTLTFQVVIYIIQISNYIFTCMVKEIKQFCPFLRGSLKRRFGYIISNRRTHTHS